MSATTFDVIVIGGGANGLVAAARVAKAGQRVLLLEAAESLGGQGRVVEIAPGFRCPPLGSDPGWLPPSVARGLGLEGLERAAVDPALTVIPEPGSALTLSSDRLRAADAIRPYSASDAAKWPAFTARLRALAGFLETLYQTPAPDVDASTPDELFAMLQLGLKFRGLGHTNMIEVLRTLPLSVWELLDDWFECVPLKAAVATTGVHDHQQGPRSGGTGYVLLHHLVGAPEGSVRGRVPWRTGPGAFTDAAERAARAAGVTLRTGARVARIQVENDTVTGVRLDGGEEMTARAVLSTASPANTLLEMIDTVWLDPEFMAELKNIRFRGCTAIVAYALDGLPDVRGLPAKDALAGTVSLTPSVVALEKAADAAKYGTVFQHPHVEFSVPTLIWPDLAPGGKHVVVARAQYAPYRLRDGAAWDAARRDSLADAVTAAIEAAAPGFRSRVLHRRAWSPLDLEREFGLREGAAPQGELGLDQILFMRPVAGWGRHTTPIEGLYLGGAGSHPGPGILGGAGWLASQRLLEDRKRSQRVA